LIQSKSGEMSDVDAERYRATPAEEPEPGVSTTVTVPGNHHYSSLARPGQSALQTGCVDCGARLSRYPPVPTGSNRSLSEASLLFRNGGFPNDLSFAMNQQQGSTEVRTRNQQEPYSGKQVQTRKKN
jgi:hypothetical protein